jgi:hypothetical protein
MELVLIAWDDAEDFTEGAWASEREAEEFAKKVYIVTSVGWIVKKNRSYLTIASDWDPNHKNYGTLRKIPRKMIKSIDTLVTGVQNEPQISERVGQKRQRHPPTPVAEIAPRDPAIDPANQHE